MARGHVAARTEAAVDWRPYIATGVVMALALVLNLWARNGLWLAYTAIGVGALGFVVGSVRAFRLRVPTPVVWMVGITAALHYVGGSMSGLHQVGGLNGLYYVFPWWDNVTHALGSAAVAVAAFALLEAKLADASAGLLGFLAVAVASLVGVAIELYEFAGFIFFGTLDQGFYTNNTLDLYYNLVGALIGTIAYARLAGDQASGKGTAPDPAA